MEKKTITFMKPITVPTTIDFPDITFVAKKVRVSTGDTSWYEMGYVPRYNGMTNSEYNKETGMEYRDIEKMLIDHVKETYGHLEKYCNGYGNVDYFVYRGNQLGLPDLPKVDREFNDDHADLVRMFTGK
jgi:hypothetical protein